MASKRRIRRNSCTGKIAHDKAGAHLHAHRLRQQGTIVFAYKCAFGDHWHVGHSARTRSRW